MTDVDYVVVGLGALGSAAAWQLASRGHSVVGLEQFELGHSRGASHDTSRILRHSYHTPAYVGLTYEAYDDWSRLEKESGESLVTVVGGIDLFPPGCAIAPDDYVDSMTERGVEFESLSAPEIMARFPVFNVPPDTIGLYQERCSGSPPGPGPRCWVRLRWTG
jgi:sarcosine oxidase